MAKNETVTPLRVDLYIRVSGHIRLQRAVSERLATLFYLHIELRKVGREGLKEIRRQVVRLKELGKTGKETVDIGADAGIYSEGADYNIIPLLFPVSFSIRRFPVFARRSNNRDF